MIKKSLYDLSKDDWNTLYPVELVDHDQQWKLIFEQERDRIMRYADTGTILRIEHFGSSSIPGIKSKPYIDIIIEIPHELLFDEDLIATFTELGYSHFKVPARDNIEAYSSFGKGYHPDGRKEQIFHIHMCPKENIMWQQIRFRDYLRTNPERAKEYEALKIELASRFRNDRGSYVLGKTTFIEETLKMSEG